jgi:VWFA-related protein
MTRWARFLRKVRAAAALLLAMMLGASLSPPRVAGQGNTSPALPQRPTPGGFMLKSQTNVVLVDVRVHDKSGKPLTDLSQKDFRVFEDGVRQTITSFSLENVEKLAQAEAANTRPPIVDLAKLPPNVTPKSALQDRRLTVLFFDVSSMPPDDLIRAQVQARKFVKSKLTPADLVAVVNYTSSLRVLQNFTNDRDALDKAIQSIAVGEESSSLSALGTVGEAGGTNANGEEIVTEDVSAAFTPDETEFNIFNTDEKLAAIESLARMLGALPGRKLLIHFSSGVERTGVENQAQLRATIDAANQANVSLYTMDTRGLLALPPGGDATTGSPSGAAVYSGSAHSSQLSSLHGSRETLASLSEDTGGRTFYDLNDFGSAFQQILTENSSYYLLGYSPSNTRSDGKFRRIRVEVDEPGVKVEARPGYFAPKNFRQFTREDKEDQLQQAMQQEEPFLDLPFVVETAYFLRPDSRYDLVLAAKIPGSAVKVLQKSDRHETGFDFVWRFTNAAGAVVGVLRDTLPVKVSGQSYTQLLASNFLYEGHLQLAPGKYHLKVLVRENETGKMGTFEAQLELPSPLDQGLALSSVVLSNELQTPGAAGPGRKSRIDADNPLEVAGRDVLPSVTRVFRTNQTLTVLLESYAGKAAKTPNGAPAELHPEAPLSVGQIFFQPSETLTAILESYSGKAAKNPNGAPAESHPEPTPSLGLVFFRGGRRVAEAGLFPGKLLRDGSGKARYFVQIPLGKFVPGRYLLQVNVLDPAQKRAAFARVAMAVVRVAPSRAAAPPAE